MTEMYSAILLRDIAHGRTGDKGDLVNISLICKNGSLYPIVQEIVTEELILELFGPRGAYSVNRYELPKLHAFNYVIQGVLGGGVNRSLYLDRHGKGLSEYLLDQPILIPRDIAITTGIFNDSH